MTIFSELHILCIELLVNGPFMHGGDFVSGMSKLCWYLDDVYCRNWRRGGSTR